LTYAQAIEYVISGKSIFTVTSVEAYAVYLAAGGSPTNIINEINKGKNNTKGEPTPISWTHFNIG